VPWVQPWGTAAAKASLAMPQNASTGRRYSARKDTRLIMPNGRSIVLERQPGADTQGFTGLEDEVDHHWGRLFMAAALSTLLGVGSELGATSNDNNIVTALRRGSSDSLSQTGQQVVRRNLNIQPTLTIRPGFQSASSSTEIWCWRRII
jgi:type IV secretory pathway VirB10-like protein